MKSSSGEETRNHMGIHLTRQTSFCKLTTKESKGNCFYWRVMPLPLESFSFLQSPLSRSRKNMNDKGWEYSKADQRENLILEMGWELGVRMERNRKGGDRLGQSFRDGRGGGEGGCVGLLIKEAHLPNRANAQGSRSLHPGQ